MTDALAPRHRAVDRCRVCGATSLWPVLSLGETPLANALVPPDGSAEEERFPLELLRCGSCGLVLLSVVVRPDVLFRHYRYATSASTPMVAHFAAYAEEVRERFAPAGSLVVEIGSNDGVLLRPLASGGVRVLGIEPSTNIASQANAAGLETWNEFFGADVARRAARDRGRAKAVLANNVLAHIDDLDEVLAGLDALLDDGGVLVAEVPYLPDLLEHVEYDTIYHEHLSYFALAPLARLIERGGLELFDVRRMSTHGGSVRIFAGRRGRHAVTPSLRAAFVAEEAAGIGDGAAYERFAARVVESRAALRQLLVGLRAEGRSVAALGATAKGNTLLNYCGIGTDLVAYVADSTPLKIGLLTPGMHIPVRPEDTIRRERPDYTLLLAWNYADAIVRRFADYLGDGGRFIHPIPIARVIAG